jgi:hypothetical protein|uniref:Uncharacterized protein n=1 Tax=viral metagenome TaxID=1070528 RepID=A0A6C0IIR5_9ZZZZ
MSSSNAAAIRRRVGAQANPLSNSTPNLNSISENLSTEPNDNKSKTYTTFEMITLLNSRVVALEKGTNQTSSNGDQNTQQELISLVDEINIRFELFANEIAEMKDTVLKLQTYTMDVNKLLVNERIQILSNMDQTEISEPEFQELDASLNNVFSNVNEVTSVDVSTLAKEEIRTNDE